MSKATSTDLEFFFDPICPFAWITSRWVNEVSAQREYTVEWRFICLAIINENADYSNFPPNYPLLHGLGKRLLRIAAAIRSEVGNDGVARFYTACGEHLHHRGVSMAIFGGDPIPENLIETILSDADLPASLAVQADNEEHDKLLRQESELAFSRTGPDVGTPILTFTPGTETEASLFGPVISSIPRGKQAVELWAAVETMARTPGFAELKRTIRAPLSFE